MTSKKFDLSRRQIFKHGAAVAAGAVISSSLLQIREARAAKASKAVAMYQDKPHGQQECDRCTHFVPGTTATANGTCQLVQGNISPKGWCVFFTPKA